MAARSRKRQKTDTGVDHSEGYPHPAEATTPPMVTFFVVRWASGVDTRESDWGCANSSVSGTYIRQLFDAVHRLLGRKYNVQTCPVRSSAELRRLTTRIRTGELRPGRMAGELSGKQIVGLYFLWPTVFSDGASACSSSSGGFVEQAALFELMREVERRGICTRFPHASHLWRVFLEKRWQAALCTAEQFKIAPTTLLPVSAILRNPKAAAAAAIDALGRLECQTLAESPSDLQVARPSSSVVAAPRRATCESVPVKTVVKLGYSWEALDVRAVGPGQQALAAALSSLVTQRGFLGECVLVQRYLPAGAASWVPIAPKTSHHTSARFSRGFHLCAHAGCV